MDAPEGCEPTDAEQDAIKQSVELISIPKQIPYENKYVPDHLRNVPKPYLSKFENESGEAICYQERRWDGEKRSFHYWTWCNDAKWRMLEPEALPLFGILELENYRTVFLHEGVNCARVARSLPSDHPWRDDFLYAAQLAWVGGAQIRTVQIGGHLGGQI